jgi:hypothetical protein
MEHVVDEARPDGKREGESPERLCAVTRAARPQSELIRFVVDPEGRIVPDLARKLPGRGVWVTGTRECVIQAVRAKAFQRSLKQEVRAGIDLADQVGELMLKRVVEHLALANKAGLAVAGTSKVERALERGRVHLLLHALEAAQDGARKLDQKFRHLLRDQGAPEAEHERRIVRFLTGDELSLAMGRPNVVHAALAAGGAARKFLDEVERLLRYRLGRTTGVAA